jgi:hypothetical protein
MLSQAETAIFDESQEAIEPGLISPTNIQDEPISFNEQLSIESSSE